MVVLNCSHTVIGAICLRYENEIVLCDSVKSSYNPVLESLFSKCVLYCLFSLPELFLLLRCVIL